MLICDLRNHWRTDAPGAILPGWPVWIALVLVLYMAAILPINVTGLVLIGLAFALFVFDAFAPTHACVDSRRNSRILDRLADVVRP